MLFFPKINEMTVYMPGTDLDSAVIPDCMTKIGNNGRIRIFHLRQNRHLQKEYENRPECFAR